MGETLSVLEVAKAAEWFAAAAAYPEENSLLADGSHHVERWLGDPHGFLSGRDRVEYTSLFDIGNPAPPAPLMESHYQQDSQAKLRQVVTFYRTYGVINETEYSPDHLCVELAFLGFLASLASDFPDRDDLAKACRFFARVHLASWLVAVIDIVEGEASTSPWIALLKAVNRFADDVASGLELEFEVERAM